VNVLLGLVGSLFAGFFFNVELARWSAEGFRINALGLPTCAYGMAFFTAVLALSITWLSNPGQAIDELRHAS
jgi:hypothetical protein